MQLPPQEAGYYGAVRFGSGALAPGRYDALLVDADGNVRSRASFWVVEPGARPALRVPATVAAKQPIRVAWRNAPGDRFDWIGIWKAGDGDLFNYYGFAYVRARVAGHATLAGLAARALRRAAAGRRRLRRAGAAVVHRRAAPLSAAPMLHRW